jgi:hypothetical protein
MFAGFSIAYFYVGGDPFFLQVFPAVPISIVLGVVIHKLGSLLRNAGSLAKLPHISNLIAFFVLIIIVTSTFSIAYPVTKLSTSMNEIVPSNFYGYETASRLLGDQTGPVVNYRVGVPSDAISPWLNAAFPNVPQTRQYEATSILNKDFLYWFELSVWGGTKDGVPYSGSMYETKFLLDWFAVKWLFVYPPFDVAKFSSDPAFRPVVPGNSSMPSGFEYDDVSPIISYSTTPSVLVVGEKTAFETLFGSLSYSELDSRSFIPVYGGKYVDELRPAELANFPAIMLYGYDFHDRQVAYSILADYVRNGGGLFLETGFSPESGASSILEPSPVTSTSATNLGTEWHLTGSRDSEILAGVNLNAFSPAIYGKDTPWGVSAARNDSVRSWASVVMWDEGQPLVVTGKFGNGRVAWSGMNLPYHTTSYLNYDESKLIGKLLAWVTNAGNATWFDDSVVRTDPQHASAKLTARAGGILYKEFNFPGWKAFALQEGRREIPIYLAGPGFMYVPGSVLQSLPGKVLFEFGPSWDVWASYATSLVTAATLLFYMLLPDFARKTGRSLRSPWTRLITWWNRED